MFRHFSVLLVLVLAQTVLAQHSLISADALFQNLQHYKVLDLRSAEEFEAGHIFSAQHVSRSQFEDTVNYPFPGMICEEEQLQNLLTSLRIERGDTIVAYDSKGGCEATRFWW